MGNILNCMRAAHGHLDGEVVKEASQAVFKLHGDAYPAATMLDAFKRLGADDLQNARLACRAFAEIGKTPSLPGWQGLLQVAIARTRAPERLVALLEHAAARGCLGYMERFEVTGLSGQQMPGFIAAFISLDAQALKHLSLQRSGLNAAETQALAGATQWTAMQHLDLGYNNLGVAGAWALAGATHLASLQHLDLWSNGVGAAGAQALAGATHLASLQYLNLGYNDVGTAGAQALAGATHLQGRLVVL